MSTTTSVNAQNTYDKFIRDYVGETAQLVKQSGLSERNTFAWEGSGTITAQGQLGLGHTNTQYLEKKVNLPSMDLQKNPSHQRVSKVQVSLSREVRLQNLSLAKESVVQNCSSQDLQKDSNLTHFPPTTGPTYTLSGVASDIAFVSDYDGAELFVVSGTIIEDFTSQRSPLQRDGIVTPVDYGSITRLQFQKISTMDLYVWLPFSRGLQVHYSWIQVRGDSWGIHGFDTPDLLISVLEHTSSPTLQMLQATIRLRIFWYYWYCHLQGKINIFGATGSVVHHNIQYSVLKDPSLSKDLVQNLSHLQQKLDLGSLFTIGGISETTAVNPPAAGTKFISGSAKVNPVPAPKGSGTITISQG